MEKEEILRIVSVESGVMEQLFDNGHIFFNIYTSPDETGQVDNTLEEARKEGADYLLELLPSESEINWHLYEVESTMLLVEGTESLAEIDSEEGTRGKWFALGTVLAQHMLPHLTRIKPSQ